MSLGESGLAQGNAEELADRGGSRTYALMAGRYSHHYKIMTVCSFLRIKNTGEVSATI